MSLKVTCKMKEGILKEIIQDQDDLIGVDSVVNFTQAELQECVDALYVGRITITVCYVACIWSPVLWVRLCHQDCIIFGFSFYIQNSAKILVELEFWIFKSDPSLAIDISLNQDYSGNSNGGIYISILALGDENQNLLCFCLPILPRKSPWGSHIMHCWKGIHEISAPLES